MSLFFSPTNALCSPVWLRLPWNQVFQKTNSGFSTSRGLFVWCECTSSPLISKVSRRVLTLHYFLHSSTATQLRSPPSPPARDPCLHAVLSVFFWQGPSFVNNPRSSSTPSSCSYRFTTRSLVVLQRRSHETSRLLTGEYKLKWGESLRFTPGFTTCKSSLHFV